MDLLPLGVAVHDFISGARPWGQLERILERLPRHSYYRAAVDDNEEIARLARALRPPTAKPRVPLVGYNEIVERLDNVFDAVNAVAAILVKIHTPKGKGQAQRPIRAPRPVTAYERIRYAEKKEKLNSIAQQMTGGR